MIAWVSLIATLGGLIIGFLGADRGLFGENLKADSARIRSFPKWLFRLALLPHTRRVDEALRGAEAQWAVERDALERTIASLRQREAQIPEIVRLCGQIRALEAVIFELPQTLKQNEEIPSWRQLVEKRLARLTEGEKLVIRFGRECDSARSGSQPRTMSAAQLEWSQGVQVAAHQRALERTLQPEIDRLEKLLTMSAEGSAAPQGDEKSG